MKFIFCVILIMILSFAVCIYFPWWSISITAFIATAIIPQSASRSFLTGFLAVFLLWGVLSLSTSANNDHILAHKVSLLILKTDSPFLLILVSAFIGALVAGFAGMAGSYLRKRSSLTSSPKDSPAPPWGN